MHALTTAVARAEPQLNKSKLMRNDENERRPNATVSRQNLCLEYQSLAEKKMRSS